MISTSCPHCKHSTSVADYLLGHGVLCDECGELYPVVDDPPRRATSPKPWRPSPRLPEIAKQYLTGMTLLGFGVVIAMVGALSLHLLPPLGIGLLAVGSILVQAGIIRWAIAPLMEQNDEVIRTLRERDR